MNSRVAELLEEIRERQEELEELVHTHEARFIYKLEGNKISFEPVIYSMIIPFALLDICVSVYQWLCFPLYRIATVKRSKYIVVDRHQLSYLNSVEKLNCAYCGYVNGLISYVREIVSRTEQYWCPIKHAHKVLDPHRRYAHFAAFGDAEAYREAMERRRG